MLSKKPAKTLPTPMDIKHIFGLISVAVAVVNLSLYISVIFSQKIKPHALSWLLWATVMAIVFAAQYADGAGAGAWQTGVGAILCGVIGIIAVFRGDRRISRSDWVAFLGALAALPLWIMTKSPFTSVILLTLIDGAGYYPTFRKSYHAPYEENISWTFRGAAAFACSIAALTHYNLVSILYPAAMVFLQLALGIMLIWRRRSIPRQRPITF